MWGHKTKSVETLIGRSGKKLGYHGVSGRLGEFAVDKIVAVAKQLADGNRVNTQDQVGNMNGWRRCTVNRRNIDNTQVPGKKIPGIYLYTATSSRRLPAACNTFF